MLIAGIVVGFILGLLLRGRPGNLLDARIRWSGLLFLAVIVRYGTELALANGVELADTLRLPLFAGAFGLLLITLWHNRAVPGMLVVMVGVAANGAAPEVETADDLRVVTELLAELPATQREVIRLRIFDNLRFREVAERVGCPLNTALARMHDGLKKLRALWEARNG